MIIDLFAGPGGADLGIRTVTSERVVGVEWDTAACQTREAAGLETVQADVAELDPAEYAGASGMWASPPCQAWSMAGKRSAMEDQQRLGAHVEACRDGWEPYDAGDYSDLRTPLVLEPLRWVDAIRPGWVALEQVPPVLDLWHHYADVLRGWGYNAWAGVLNAADYGVPQTRQRAILMARRDGPVVPPEPTHAEHPEPAGLFGAARLPWVTMAEALGWDGIVKPDRGSGLIERHGDRQRTSDQPAYAVRAGGSGGMVFMAAGETGKGRPRDPNERPADTISDKGTAYWVNGNQANSAVRSQDEPAPTIHFGHRCNDVKWVHERPPTTVCADPRSPEPGYRGNPDDYKDGEPTRLSDNAERVTVEQAAILQGFPPDHPWQGSKTKKFEQVGNAVPPPLAAAVVAPLLDANEREVAA